MKYLFVLNILIAFLLFKSSEYKLKDVYFTYYGLFSSLTFSFKFFFINFLEN